MASCFLWLGAVLLSLFFAGVSFDAAALDADEKKDKLRYLIQDVHRAADDGDIAALAALLPPVFKYSFGGDDTREGAVRYSTLRPDKLRVLAGIIATGCRQQSEDFYACPPQDADRSVIYFGPRAAFEFDNDTQTWLFKYFVEDD